MNYTPAELEKHLGHVKILQNIADGAIPLQTWALTLPVVTYDDPDLNRVRTVRVSSGPVARHEDFTNRLLEILPPDARLVPMLDDKLMIPTPDYKDFCISVVSKEFDDIGEGGLMPWHDKEVK